MKEKTKKIVAFISILILIVNIINPIIFAADEDTEASQTPDNEYARQEEEAFDNAEGEGGGGFWDGVAGILLYPVKLIPIGVGELVRVISGTVAALGGNGADVIHFSIDKVFFNEVPLTRLDFFDFSTGNATMSELKKNIAQWYYILRNISVVILLGILIYVGIRMALSTVAEEEAKYKKMLQDWIVSIVLLFVLHYIIIFVITINDQLIEMLKGIRTGVLSKGGENAFQSTLNWILSECWGIFFSKSFGSCIIFVILSGVSFIFLLSYIKRMVTVAFLIMISPLIVITYSIDKMGDGKSQALNTWLKEFCFNVLIQPFHCIIYLSLVVTGVNMMADATSFASTVLAITLVLFIYKAEDIVKNIFGFQSESLGKTIASAAVMTSALSNMGKGKSKTKNGSGGGSSGSGSGSSAGIPAPKSKMPTMKDFNKKGGNNSGSGGDDGSPAPQEKDNPKEPPSKGKQIAKRTGQLALQGAKGYLGAMATLGAVVAGAALGAATGKMETAYLGAKAANNLRKNAQSSYKGSKSARKLKQNQKYFASATKDYQAKTGLDDEQLATRSRQLLNMSDDQAANANLTEEDKNYRDYLQAMDATYGATGMDEKDSKQAVLDTIRAVQDGSIKSSYKQDIKNIKNRDEDSE